MRRPRLPALLLLALASAASAQAPQAKGVPDRIRACSVSVETDAGGGSGTLLRGRDGAYYCLTAAHVIAGHAKAKVCRHLTDAEGRSRGHWAEADVLHRCAARDLALLRVGKEPLPGAGRARLHAGGLPGPDTPVYACGSAGLAFHHSLHRGHVTAVGRRLGGPLYDEYDIAGGPGTSGCGVFLRTGELVGVHSASNRLRAGLFVPVRVIRAWAEEGGFLELLDPCERIAAPQGEKK